MVGLDTHPHPTKKIPHVNHFCTTEKSPKDRQLWSDDDQNLSGELGSDPPKKSGTGFHSHIFPYKTSIRIYLVYIYGNPIPEFLGVSGGIWYRFLHSGMGSLGGVAPGRSTKRRQVYDKSTLSGSHRSEQKNNMKVVVTEAQKRKQQGFL